MKILNIMHQLLKKYVLRTIIDVAKEMSSEAFMINWMLVLF